MNVGSMQSLTMTSSQRGGASRTVAFEAKDKIEGRRFNMRKIMYALSAIALGGMLAAAAVAMDPYPDVVFGARQSVMETTTASAESSARAEAVWLAAQRAVQDTVKGE